MSMQDQLKRGADQNAGVAREAMRKGETKAQEALGVAQEGFQMAGESTRQMSLKLIEIMRANAEALFDFAEELATARDPAKVTAVFSKHIQNQMALFGKQSMDLLALGQRMATTGATTMSDRMR